MALPRWTTLSVLLGAAVIAGVESNLVSYLEKDPHDPENVALVREALTQLGVDATGIRVVSFYTKWLVVRTSYKATYIDRLARKCYIHFHWTTGHGLRATEMPICQPADGSGIVGIGGGGSGIGIIIGVGGGGCSSCSPRPTSCDTGSCDESD